MAVSDIFTALDSSANTQEPDVIPTLSKLGRSIQSGMKAALVAAVATASFAAAAAPYPYTSLTIFGDSLSDTGNLNIATGGAQPNLAGGPYAGGRFSDGLLWVESFAAGLGLATQANPYVNPNVGVASGNNLSPGCFPNLCAPLPAGGAVLGNNYAYAGARTGTSSAPPGILAQVGGIWAPTHPTADANGLYVLVAGGNDLRDARTAFTTTSAADQASRQAAAQAVADNLRSAIGLLALRGVRYLLLADVPDLGATPEAFALGLQASSSDVSNRFNALMPGVAAYARSLGMNVDLLELSTLTAAIRYDANLNRGAYYGITNAIAPCAGFTGSLGNPCSTSLFSDGLHPSAAAGAIVSRLALSLVPEPTGLALASLGLVGLALVRRRQRT